MAVPSIIVGVDFYIGCQIIFCGVCCVNALAMKDGHINAHLYCYSTPIERTPYVTCLFCCRSDPVHLRRGSECTASNSDQPLGLHIDDWSGQLTSAEVKFLHLHLHIGDDISRNPCHIHGHGRWCNRYQCPVPGRVKGLYVNS